MTKTDYSSADIQRWMQHILVQQSASRHPGNLINATVADIVRPSTRLSADRHLAIYRMSYIARLRECMRNQFAALAYALGNDLFEAFTDQYLDVYPSHSYTLNDLGANFPAFLEETRPDKDEPTRELWPDFMIELAKFEYALSLIFDEHAADDLTLATSYTPDEELRLPPVFHLFQHRFPVCSFYLDFHRQNNPQLPFPADSWCVVTRRQYKLGLFHLKPAQYHFLTLMQQTGSVAAATTLLCQTFNFAPAQVATIWPEWRAYFIESGFLCCAT